MKEEDSKNQNAISMANNPFLTRPLKPIKDSNQGPDKSNESHKDIKNISEHRASKFINLPYNFKNSKTIFTERKQNEVPTNLNSKSPKSKIKLFGDKNKGNENQGGFVSVLNKFISQEKIKKEEKEESKKFRKRGSVEKYINTKLQENFKKTNEIVEPKNFNTNQNDKIEEKKDKNSPNMKIQVTTKANLENKVNNINNDSKKENGLIYFKNDDEILEYIKNKIKEGKIENIIQKLEIKNNNFTGFSICKKNNGYTTCEIDVEDDIQKINDIFKNQKITIKNKPIKLVYAEENIIKSKQENDNINESNISKVKNEPDKAIYMEKLKDKIKNRALENQNIKDEKMNNEIKNLQDKISKYKEELKENDKENSPKKNIKQPESKDVNSNKQNLNSISIGLDSKGKRRESGIKVNVIPKSPEEQTNPQPPEIVPDPNEKKEMIIANKGKRVSNAYIRFKRACSLHKDKPPAATNSGNGGGGGSKIQSLASMLQDHIIKPLAEIQEEKEAGKKIYRGASVECSRKSKIGDDFVLLFQNAPVTKKKVKKPKLNNFLG